MKFKWRLDRILEIKNIHEETLKAQMVELTQKKISMQSQVMLLKAGMTSSLKAIRQLPIEERLEKQKLAMNDCERTTKQIADIKKKILILDKEKQIKDAEITEARKARKSLEKLREKAFEEFKVLSSKQEQNEIDEIVSASYSRRIIHSQTYSV